MSIINLYLECLLMWMNLYIQFSGYSDIAIGVSKMCGITVMENFNYPFIASNINDFWKRWHISLTSWSKEYVFIPIASATRKPFLAVVLAMMVIAFWHEISIRYVAWGLYHGCGIAVWHIYNRKISNKIKFKSPFLKRSLRVLSTLNFKLYCRINHVQQILIKYFIGVWMYSLFRKYLPKKLADIAIIVFYVILLFLIFVMSAREDVGFIYLNL